LIKIKIDTDNQEQMWMYFGANCRDGGGGGGAALQIWNLEIICLNKLGNNFFHKFGDFQIILDSINVEFVVGI